MHGKPFRLAVLFLFLFSGASGLIYQIVWTKELYLIMGVTVYAVSTVLASFMAGLALGSHLFGKWVDRVRKPLLLYAILEGGIGLYALLVPPFFWLVTRIYIYLHEPVGDFQPLLLTLRFLLCFIVLLIPTTLMGGTLPVLTKFFVERERSIGLGVGLLYAINTAGAVLGTFFAGFFLIPFLGISRTTAIAVAVNIGIALLALVMALTSRGFTPRAPKVGPAGEEPGSGTPAERRAVIVVFWAIGLAGFASLGYEILWTRILVYFLGPSTYAFTAMLTTFLVGIALGSVLIARFTDRMSAPVLVFGFIEVGVGLSALAAVLLTGRMFEIGADLRAFFQSSSWWVSMGVRFSLAFVFMFLPTLLMGAAFPVAARIYSRSLHTIGRRVGNIYSINTLCAIFGSLATGFLLIPALGLLRSMVLLSCLNILIGIALFLASPGRRLATKVLLTTFGIVCMGGALTRFENIEVIREHGLTKAVGDQVYKVIYCKEGIDASLAVLEGQTTGSRQLNINGTSTAYTDLPDLQVHRLLAHIPMAIHPDPKQVLIIGFGFGSTAYGTMQYDPENVDCVELVEDERETADYFLDQNHGILEDPRFNFIAEDGRNFVLTTRKTYDVISLNAIHPSLGPTLYTHDFFMICREKLKPDGLICVWLPTTMLSTEEYRILIRSFQNVFPSTTFWYNNPGNTIVLGGTEPYLIDFAGFTANLERPGVRADLEPVNLADPFTFLNLLIMRPEQVAEYVAGARLNTDDQPWIEFSRSMYAGFREDMLERIFFTVKANPYDMLAPIPDSEAKRESIRRRMDRYCHAWPYIVEGHLLSLAVPSDAERSSALSCFQQALRFVPKDPQFRFLARVFGVKQGTHAWRIGRIEEALKGKTAGAEEERKKLGLLYLEIGEFEKALELLQPFAKQPAHETLDFLLALAFAYEGNGLADRAIELLWETSKRFPGAAAPHARLVWPLLLREDTGSKREALKQAREAVRLEETAEHLDLLGVALHENGALEEAEDALEKAVKKSGIIIFAYKFHLSQVRMALK